MNSSKKRTNEFVFTTMQRVFVRFLEEIEVNKKTFRNYLSFRKPNFRPRNNILFSILLQFCKYAGTQICTIKYLLSFTYFNTVVSFNYTVCLSKKKKIHKHFNGEQVSYLCTTIASPKILSKLFELFIAKDFD